MKTVSNALFVTGTDTEVGKTVVAGLLGRYLLEKGLSVITQKPIQTGASGFSPDVAAHLKLMGRTKKDFKKYLRFVVPYTFRLAASAHLAARAENKRISAVKIKKSFEFLAKEFDFVIVEGIGGALVPFNNKRVVIDIAANLKLPAVIVAKNKLGAINHTLLTIEALRSRNVKILGIIFNSGPGKQKKLIAKDNPKIIEAISSEKVLGILQWSKDHDCLRKSFLPIADKIFAKLREKSNESMA